MECGTPKIKAPLGTLLIKFNKVIRRQYVMIKLKCLKMYLI